MHHLQCNFSVAFGRLFAGQSFSRFRVSRPPSSDTFVNLVETPAEPLPALAQPYPKFGMQECAP